MNPETEFHIISKKKSPSEPNTNIVNIIINTKSDEIIQDDPITGHHRTVNTELCPSLLVQFTLDDNNPRHIHSLLENQPQIISQYSWLCEELVSKISACATRLGFGHNYFNLTIFVIVTYVPRDDLDLKLMMILRGRIGVEELKMETEEELCSICLENLFSGSSKLTRMSCSHVFHDRCLFEWFQRKNSCPLCRTVLYDRFMA